MKLPKTKVIVRKKEWGTTQLYSKEKKSFCIVGFFLNQVCEIPEETLNNKYFPYVVLDIGNIYLNQFSKEYSFGEFKGMPLLQTITHLNDKHLNNKKTQKTLKSIFKRYLNCQLVFKD